MPRKESKEMRARAEKRFAGIKGREVMRIASQLYGEDDPDGVIKNYIRPYAIGAKVADIAHVMSHRTNGHEASKDDREQTKNIVKDFEASIVEAYLNQRLSIAAIETQAAFADVENAQALAKDPISVQQDESSNDGAEQVV